MQLEEGLPFDPVATAQEVDAALLDRRSWGAPGRPRLVRVATRRADLVVRIATASTTDRLCAPLDTRGWLSCRTGRTAVINAERWARGAQTYGADLASYRAYVVNHEVGHLLGHDHRRCPRRGALAPVMVQQTKRLQGCRPNPWPFPRG